MWIVKYKKTKNLYPEKTTGCGGRETQNTQYVIIFYKMKYPADVFSEGKKTDNLSILNKTVANAEVIPIGYEFKTF